MFPPSLTALLVVMSTTPAPAPQLAQVERFLLAPGSNVGPSTRIVPTNCYRSRSGEITCDTKVVNPPGTTEARPVFSPFPN